MNLETQQQHFDRFIEEQRAIMFRKGNDYANTDRLSNFKLAGAIAQSTGEGNCLALIATKVARLGVLLQDLDKAPENESLSDTLKDCANYCVLMDMLLADRAAGRDPLPETVSYTTTTTDSRNPTVVFKRKTKGIIG